MKIKYYFFNPNKKESYNVGGRDSKSFSSISDAVEHIKNDKSSPYSFDRITVEQDGKEKLLVANYFKGDNNFESYGIPSLSQDDSNKYRPYPDGFKVMDYGLEFLDITSIYIQKNTELKIDSSASQALYDNKQASLQSIASLREKFESTTQENQKKPKV